MLKRGVLCCEVHFSSSGVLLIVLAQNLATVQSLAQPFPVKSFGELHSGVAELPCPQKCMND